MTALRQARYKRGVSGRDLLVDLLRTGVDEPSYSKEPGRRRERMKSRHQGSITWLEKHLEPENYNAHDQAKDHRAS